jgi:hypothetical protein
VSTQDQEGYRFRRFAVFLGCDDESLRRKQKCVVNYVVREFSNPHPSSPRDLERELPVPRLSFDEND